MTRMYQSSAYNSQSFSPQPARPAAFWVDKLISQGQQILPWTKPLDELCTSINAQICPGIWKQSSPEMGWDMSRLWNEQTVTGIEGNGWLQFYLFWAGMARILVIFFGPLVLLATLLSLTVYDISSRDFRFEIYYLTFICLPSLILWGHKEAYFRGILKSPFLDKALGARKVFELNRHTGMVTLFKKNGEVIYSHPFIEFDCLFSSTPMPKGVMVHSLSLVHRYSGSKHLVPLTLLLSETEVSSDFYRLWNNVQQFMDISSPLPDMYTMEPFRELDPTTQAYDKEQERPPRHWRDMTDEEYADFIADIRHRQAGHQYTLGQPINIFADVD